MGNPRLNVPRRGIGFAGLFRWYGEDPAFQIWLERRKKKIPEAVEVVHQRDRRIYLLRALRVPGDLERHDITIIFSCRPPWWASGPAEDWPRVFTDVDRPRKHHYADGSLCMWAPFDPPERQWHHGDGLHVLVEIIRRHLFYELHWWRTGGLDGGEWPVEDAPHGLPKTQSLEP